MSLNLESQILGPQYPSEYLRRNLSFLLELYSCNFDSDLLFKAITYVCGFVGLGSLARVLGLLHGLKNDRESTFASSIPSSDRSSFGHLAVY